MPSFYCKVLLLLFLNKMEWVSEASKGRNFHVEKNLTHTCIWYRGDLFVCLSIMVLEILHHFWTDETNLDKKLGDTWFDLVTIGWVVTLLSPHLHGLGHDLGLFPGVYLLLGHCCCRSCDTISESIWQTKQKCENGFVNLAINLPLWVMRMGAAGESIFLELAHFL